MERSFEAIEVAELKAELARTVAAARALKVEPNRFAEFFAHIVAAGFKAVIAKSLAVVKAPGVASRLVVAAADKHFQVTVAAEVECRIAEVEQQAVLGKKTQLVVVLDRQPVGLPSLERH